MSGHLIAQDLIPQTELKEEIHRFAKEKARPFASCFLYSENEGERYGLQ